MQTIATLLPRDALRSCKAKLHLERAEQARLQASRRGKERMGRTLFASNQQYSTTTIKEEGKCCKILTGLMSGVHAHACSP